MRRRHPRGDLRLTATPVIGVGVAPEARPAAEFGVCGTRDRVLAGESGDVGRRDPARARTHPRDAVAGVRHDARLEFGIHPSTLTPASDPPVPYTPLCGIRSRAERVEITSTRPTHGILTPGSRAFGDKQCTR